MLINRINVSEHIYVKRGGKRLTYAPTSSNNKYQRGTDSSYYTQTVTYAARHRIHTHTDKKGTEKARTPDCDQKYNVSCTFEIYGPSFLDS